MIGRSHCLLHSSPFKGDQHGVYALYRFVPGILSALYWRGCRRRDVRYKTHSRWGVCRHRQARRYTLRVVAVTRCDHAARADDPGHLGQNKWSGQVSYDNGGFATSVVYQQIKYSLNAGDLSVVLPGLTTQSVAERTNGRVTALFCCGDKAPAESSSRPVAAATTMAVPKSGARIIGFPLPFSAEIAGTGGGGQLAGGGLPVPPSAVL